MEDLQILEMCPKSGGVPAVLGGAMTSLWVGCWRSEVPSVYSPECVEGLLRSSPNDDSRKFAMVLCLKVKNGGRSPFSQAR
jgi:hypothetical protein